MTHSRLLFLYPPTLFRVTNKILSFNSPATTTFRCHKLRLAVRGPAWAGIQTRGRHGKAVEPPEFLKQQQQEQTPQGGDGPAGAKDVAGDKSATTGGDKGKKGEEVPTAPSHTIPPSAGVNPGGTTASSSSPSPAPTPPPPPLPPATPSTSSEPPSTPPSPDLKKPKPPLMPTPTPTPTPPPPPIPHIFDTYTLVHRLSPPYTPPQSVALMHLIRHLLNHQFSLAQANLLSRSTLENTNYLFRAASAELRSEISALRASQLEKMRQERAQAQREFELLNGRFMEELMVCGNELRGMFNDRKMVNKSEQREVENKIQELNYKITVLMGSELKSEVEKLRWVTTRRGLIAIGLLAAFIVSLIKLSQNNQKREKEREKAAAAAAAAHEYDHDHGNGHGHLGAPREIPIDGLVHTAGPGPLA